MREANVAIAGATGLVGREFIRVLEERRFPLASVRLLASERSEGKILRVNGCDLEVERLTEDSFKGIDIALFSSSSASSAAVQRS